MGSEGSHRCGSGECTVPGTAAHLEDGDVTRGGHVTMPRRTVERRIMCGGY